ncbi:MAG TPA: NAD(P)H-binding protein [Candidatus Limnocylindrales bacterium]
MSRIVIYGAGGKAGRRAVAEAVRRGHEVTGVGRGPANGLKRGDVTDAASVAATATGHDVAVSTVYRPDVDAGQFYLSTAGALIEGLAKAGVGRLIVIGMDPRLGNDFSDARAAELEYLQRNAGELDWVFLVPPPVVLTDDGYAEVAVALLDEIERPTRHRAPLPLS